MYDKKREIGLRLKEYAEKNFSTFADFARAMGKDVTYFTNYYKGKSVLGGELLAQLAELGCDINWLLNGANNKPTLRKEGTVPYMTFAELNNQIKELQNAINLLKIENYDLRKERDLYSNQCEQLRAEIKELQEEIKKLNIELRKPNV